MINSIVSQGLIWAILGLGIFMTFRILDFPDMTTEGSFPLGGAGGGDLDYQRGQSTPLQRWLLLEQGAWRDLRRVFSTQRENPDTLVRDPCNDIL